MGKPGPKSPITAGPLDLSDAPERGWPRVVWFAQRFLKVPKGEGALDPFVLRDWQVDLVRAMLPAASEGGRPRQGLISMPRGNGKTSLAAVLAVYGLFADEVEGAQVLVVASDERQAGHTLRAAARMIELSPELAERTHVYRDRLHAPLTDSEMRALPADVGALQGWDPSLQIVDELHVVTPEVWEAVTSAAGKRAESLTLAISTPAASTESVMWRLVEQGRREPDSPELVYREFGAPDGCALDDEGAWAAANPALGDFLAVDALRSQVRVIREPAFRRYRLGQWVGSENTWLPLGVFAALARPHLLGARQKVVLAFDGSASGDATALVGCTVGGGKPYLFVVGLWENPNHNKPGWRVPRAEVDQAVAEAFRRYDVVELACDPWGWQSEIQAWAARHGERRVVEFNTAHARRMAPATDKMYELVMEGRVEHDGDERLVRHFENAVARSTPLGDLVSKDKKGSHRKIDSAVAGIVAVDRATFHTNKPARIGSFSA
ncbi:terminase large subunit domain-containing protein [Dermacoccus nishinomiyaensis]|uniref:terminase large subunit domain-containing protein n=1 Tax=Dermacoccus nishinomiyaensis TaxID=1274 RepID=UPI00248F11ED|nr:terminase large subunit [Dermacoccus nishinomiyaensis]